MASHTLMQSNLYFAGYGTEKALMHYGRSKKDGAPGPGSGRYPLGSGGNNKRQKPSLMSDDELRQRISRLNMEEQYASLLARQKERETSGIQKTIVKALDRLSNRAIDVAIDCVVNGVIDAKNSSDIKRLTGKDVYDMDEKTIKRVKDWYINANTISTMRSKMND